MLVTLNRNIISVLGLAVVVSTAPLNERANGSRGIVGWLCHYDGPSTPLVDASLDLPSMLGGLCAKVNYDYAGCESFDPNPNSVLPDPSPSDDGTAVQSASVDQDEDQTDGSHKQPKKPKKNNLHHGSSTQSAPVPKDVDDKDSRKQPKHPKSKRPQQKGEEGGDNSVTAHSFNDSGLDEPELPHHSHGSKPHATTSEHDSNSSVGALSNGEGDDDDNYGCKPNEKYSSELDRCFDQSYFSPPQSDGTCKSGTLDAVIHICLDISTLGLTAPLHAETSVLKSGAGSNGNQKCPLGQQYSSLLSVCVNDTFFSHPLADDQCQHGWKLDLVLGICLDLVGCQNQSNES